MAFFFIALINIHIYRLLLYYYGMGAEGWLSKDHQFRQFSDGLVLRAEEIRVQEEMMIVQSGMSVLWNVYPCVK
jgi:hypothetical protein